MVRKAHCRYGFVNCSRLVVSDRPCYTVHQFSDCFAALCCYFLQLFVSSLFVTGILGALMGIPLSNRWVSDSLSSQPYHHKISELLNCTLLIA
jgi:hypothetical protein